MSLPVRGEMIGVRMCQTALRRGWSEADSHTQRVLSAIPVELAARSRALAPGCMHSQNSKGDVRGFAVKAIKDKASRVQKLFCTALGVRLARRRTLSLARLRGATPRLAELGVPVSRVARHLTTGLPPEPSRRAQNVLAD